MSEDGGVYWRQVHLPSDPRARLLVMLSNGEVMVGGAKPGHRMVRVEDFVRGPPP
jgi:hypothetical protein